MSAMFRCPRLLAWVSDSRWPPRPILGLVAVASIAAMTASVSGDAWRGALGFCLRRPFSVRRTPACAVGDARPASSKTPVMAADASCGSCQLPDPPGSWPRQWAWRLAHLPPSTLRRPGRAWRRSDAFPERGRIAKPRAWPRRRPAVQGFGSLPARKPAQGPYQRPYSWQNPSAGMGGTAQRAVKGN